MNEREGIIFPYVYGSLAFSMGKKGENYTHKWICYVRGVHNEDLSYLIKKVVFTLHVSFENRIKEVYNPPYEIQQLGWGQFEILIQIHFNHPDMPYIQIPHMLKLHHTHTTGSQTSKKPLCSQIYDEIIFTQSDEHIERMKAARDSIMNKQVIMDNDSNDDYELAVAQQPLKSITQYSRYLTAMDPEDHRVKLQDALRFIKGEVSSLEQKMRIADIDIQKVYEQVYNKL